MVQYFSTKNSQFVHIDGMATNHIKRALEKIRKGCHEFYPAGSSRIQEALLTELDARNTKQLEYFKERALDLTARCNTAAGRIASLQSRLESAEDTISNFEAKAYLESRAVTPYTLDNMRDTALSLVQRYGSVTADTLRLEIGRHWYAKHIPSNMHALAHVFRDKAFRKIGFVKSKIRSNHGRFISVWGAAASL